LREKTRVPYGAWSSPITAEMVARAEISLSGTWLEDGVAWWLEGRPSEAGRVVLMQSAAGQQPQDVTPSGFNVRTMVHEYGGGAYAIHDGIVYFSNFDDQRLYRQVPGEEPAPITPEVEGRRHRYADGRVTADGSLWIGVRERHEGSGGPDEVVNELVVLPIDGSAPPRTIAGGRDFYSNPRISADGRRLCFLAWNLPWMPWDGC
jgi:sugar lactone lactonase YvrE